MHILVTGFDAYNNSQANPSEKVVRSLESQPPYGINLHTLVLPVDTNQAVGILLTNLQAVQPQAVLCLGEASDRACISIERVALNLLDFRIPDNAGVQIVDLPINPSGPAAYFTSLPVRLLQQVLIGHGIPVELSMSAGSYLCNQVFYELLHWREINNLSIPAGFIHLPSLPEQVAQRETRGPSMSLETIDSACRLIISAISQM